MSIIGINGRMQSGKDLTGTIIRYCCNIKWDHPQAGTLEHFEKFAKLTAFGQEWENDWEIKKFAAKLKQCLSIILNIPLEDLEKEEVKSSVLGNEWSKIKHDCAKCDYSQRDSDEYVCMADISVDCPDNTNTYIPITVRQFLQELGTDVCRQIHPNTWVNALFVDYKAELNDAYNPNAEPEYPNWIITDVRFPNEAEAIKERGGIVIRINRLNSTSQDGHTYICKHDRTHPSETALDDYKFDYVVENNSTIEDLIEKIKQILTTEKLIK